MLAQNAWYFINALVRANYTNIEKGIFGSTRYMELFLENLLFNRNNNLKIDIYILDGMKRPMKYKLFLWEKFKLRY